MASSPNTSGTGQGRVCILASWVGPADAQQDEDGDLQARWASLQEREQRQRLAELDLEQRLESFAQRQSQLEAAARDQPRPQQQENVARSTAHEALDRESITATAVRSGGTKTASAEHEPNEEDKLRAEVQSLRQELADNKSQIEDLVARNAVLVDELGNLRENRRILFHQYSSHRKNMEVMVRVRPVRDGEMGLPAIAVKQSQSGRLEVSCPTNPSLAVAHVEADRVFDQTTTNAEIYLEIARHPWSLLEGRNVCIAAYGQTGSGKTYMMSYVSREVVAELFRNVLRDTPGCTYTLKARCVEVYINGVRDLLSGEGGGKKPTLRVRDDEKQGLVTVEGCMEQPLESEEDWDHVLKQVERCRKTSAVIPKGHSIAHQSSRSNLVLTIILEGHGSNGRSRAQLDLVDLAGSEGVPESAKDDAGLKKETAAINTTLLALGKVIDSLGNRNSHVPYNEMTLTKLLKYSLGFGARSLFLVTASPLARDFLQTKSSLMFSSKVLHAHVSRAKLKEGVIQKTNSLGTRA
ncbi:hypothetical protein PG988_004927 [Apiospora saccharicola]